MQSTSPPDAAAQRDSRLRIGRWLLPALLLALTACQPSMTLMPSPIMFTKGDPRFEDNLASRNAPEIPIFYVTNRQVLMETDNPVHTVFPGNELRLGVSHLRVGDGSMTWEALNALSNGSDDSRRPRIYLEKMEQIAVIGEGRDTLDSPAAREFFDRINAALAQTHNQNLLIYVHGANNAVHRATGQAAQLQHFTGRESVILTFIWPSAERVRTYFRDIRTARDSIPEFTRTLEVLAANTNARQIDVLAYSAGAEIASAGLGELGTPRAGETRETLKQRLRLGQIYFAAPDVDTRAMADDVGKYIDLADRVTLSANLNDSALALAAVRHRASRAGRPDASELSSEQTGFLVKASNQYDFDLIKVDPRVIPDMSRTSHGFWYTDPWVSNDVVATFVLRTPPARRGLDPQTTPTGVRYWEFPSDYPQRIAALLGSTAPAEPATPP